MSEESDQSEVYDSESGSESDDSCGDEEERESYEEPSEECGLLMAELIRRISSASKKAKESGAEGDKSVIVGDILLSEVQELRPTVAEQEEIVSKWTKVIVMAVESNSDYRERFWEASHFFRLAIESFSVPVVLDTVKACVAVYNTEQSSDVVEDSWARAAAKRCARLIRVESPEEVLGPEVLKAVKDARFILDQVCEAGYNFQDIIKADADLKDSLAELNLLVVQAPTNSSVFSAVNKRAAALLRKEVLRIESMSCDSAEGTLIALEQSVDLANPSGASFLGAHNAMCDRQPSDLELQVRAAQGSLAKLAVQALFQQNEHKQGKKHLFSEALCFLRLLLEPWQRDDSAHMAAKLQIATSLLELDVVAGLLRQFSFWVEHKFGYGDGGEPAVISLLELVWYFPNLIGDKILPNADAVTFIRHLAESSRASTMFSTRLTGERAAVIIEALMDGVPEPPTAPEKKPRGVGAKA